MKTLLGVQVTDEEFDKLCSITDKKLGVVNGKVVALEPTKEELKQRRIYEIQIRLENLTRDFIQSDLGAVFDDLEARKSEFKTLHNELRELQGKEQREYK